MRVECRVYVTIDYIHDIHTTRYTVCGTVAVAVLPNAVTIDGISISIRRYYTITINGLVYTDILLPVVVIL
jgi:hypothetical protein